MKTIEKFCHIHHACPEGREWAIANCSNMQEAWDKAPDPSWVLWIATRQGVLTDRELRLFAVWCARQVQHLLTDPRSVNAIDVAERYANGEATDEDLAAARDAARAVAYDASYAAAWPAPYAAAAARGAAWAAARGAAWAAGRAAAWAASYAAPYAVATATQAQWLREITKPKFD
jgi:hypothetical protein